MFINIYLRNLVTISPKSPETIDDLESPTRNFKLLLSEERLENVDKKTYLKEMAVEENKSVGVKTRRID